MYNVRRVFLGLLVEIEEVVSMSEELRERVRERYAEAARSVKERDDGDGCCGSSCCGFGSEAQRANLTGGSYSSEELNVLPEDAVGASLGCGNPTALATLSPPSRRTRSSWIWAAAAA